MDSCVRQLHQDSLDWRLCLCSAEDAAPDEASPDFASPSDFLGHSRGLPPSAAVGSPELAAPAPSFFQPFAPSLPPSLPSRGWPAPPARAGPLAGKFTLAPSFKRSAPS